MADPQRRLREHAAMSLDEQIALAELQVIARDARIRHRTQVLVRRVRHEAFRHAGAGALLGLGGVALAWWLKRLKRGKAAEAAPAAAPAPAHDFEHLLRDAGITLTGLLPMLWPLLPRAWRRLVTPGTASTLLSVVAPLLGRLFRRRRPAAPPS